MINPEFAVKMCEILKTHETTFEPWMMRRLEHKVLIVLEAMLEGNKNMKILKKMTEIIGIKGLA